MEEKTPKPWTRENAFDKAVKYCLYQERCTQEVYDKLRTHKIFEPLRQEIIDRLLEEQYIDEIRYVSAVIRGKSNGLKWGRNKIKSYLSTKRIPLSLINEALDGLIDDDQKISQLTTLIQKKINTLKKEPDFTFKNKINAAMVRKGYNLDSINKAWDEIKRGQHPRD
jgi:regulatory protein